MLINWKPHFYAQIQTILEENKREKSSTLLMSAPNSVSKLMNGDKTEDEFMYKIFNQWLYLYVALIISSLLFLSLEQSRLF